MWKTKSKLGIPKKKKFVNILQNCPNSWPSALSTLSVQAFRINAANFQSNLTDLIFFDDEAKIEVKGERRDEIEEASRRSQD
jgi:hypothetical protein